MKPEKKILLSSGGMNPLPDSPGKTSGLSPLPCLSRRAFGIFTGAAAAASLLLKSWVKPSAVNISLEPADHWVGVESDNEGNEK